MLSAREVAIRILAERGDLSRVSHLEGLAGQRDRALVRELVSGTLKWRMLLDHLVASFSDRPLSRISRRVVDVLRVGAFQLVVAGFPPYAAVDSAVSCLQGKGERAFANGVLRAIARNLGHVEMPSLDADPAAYVSLRYSYPLWIARLFIERFGLAGAMALSYKGNEAPPLTLRVNTLRVSRDGYLTLLRNEGRDAAPGITADFVRLAGGADVTALPGFREGLFVVQDEGASAASLAVDPRPGDTVWDVCAAPGGKTTHLAEMMEGRGELLATDIDGRRVAMVREAASRLGFGNVKTATLDATEVPQSAPRFDRVLVDAPCSGLGVLRRNADLRWNRRPADVAALAARQSAILSAVTPHLLPGGALVYSTCTLTEQENERVGTAFLRGHPEFAPFDPALGAPEPIRSMYSDAPFAGPGYRYLLPQFSGTDGFFVARAVKRG